MIKTPREFGSNLLTDSTWKKGNKILISSLSSWALRSRIWGKELTKGKLTSMKWESQFCNLSEESDFNYLCHSIQLNIFIYLNINSFICHQTFYFEFHFVMDLGNKQKCSDWNVSFGSRYTTSQHIIISMRKESDL